MGKKHRNKAKPSRIWSFGAGEPTENLDLVMAQLKLAHQYRNTLCALERQRRAEFHATVQCLFPGLESLERGFREASAKLVEYEDGMKNRNSQSQRRHATTEDRSTVRQLKANKKAAKTALDKARREFFVTQEMIDAQEALNFGHQARTQLARAEHRNAGLHWGTYLKVEDACKDFNRGTPPTFVRYSGEGKIAVQLQAGSSKKPATVADIIGGNDSRLKIIPGKTRRDKSVKATVRLRIGTEHGGRDPIWTSFPVVLHRPLPQDARVTWAWLIRRREQGTHWRWDFQIVLAQDSWDDCRRQNGKSKVGIDVGWRWLGQEFNSGLRVCACVGSDGRRWELVIPAEDVRRWAKAPELRGKRDELFNEARDWLAAWITGREIPQWLAEETATLRQWRSPRRLASLVIRWRDNRFNGDDEAIERLEGRRVEDGVRPSASGPKTRYRYTGWRKQDRHLYNWERAAEEKACRWRDHLFREFVRKLAEEYADVHIEAKFIARVAKRRAVDDTKKELNQKARRNRVVASPGRLATLFKEVFGKDHAYEFPPAYTSQRCHHCKCLKAFANPNGLIRTCRHCGVTDDRDWCAATNLRDASPNVVNETPAPARETQIQRSEGNAMPPRVA